MKRKYPRLPNGFGSIRYISPGRSKPYAVHPPWKDSARPNAICYVADWYVGFAVLTAWHAGTYYPGMENEICRPARLRDGETDPAKLCEQIIRDYGRMNHKRSGYSVGEVYELYLAWKYGENAARQLSTESKSATEAAFELLHPFHSRLMDDVEIREWQDYLNRIGKKYSRSTARNAVGLVKNLYSYAVPRELCRKDYGNMW